jgi:hypothetical protein
MSGKVHVEIDKKFCINCDNKHGCKSGTPPCIGEMMKNSVTGQSGKDYFTKTNKLHRCQGCAFLRSCWTEEEFHRALQGI